MFKLSNTFGLRQPVNSLTKHQTDLLQITNEQAMAVAAGNTDPTVKETPAEKPQDANTKTTTANDTTPGVPWGSRPPFN